MQTKATIPNKAMETESVLGIGQIETSGLKLELSSPCGLLAALTASESMVSWDTLHTLPIPESSFYL